MEFSLNGYMCHLPQQQSILEEENGRRGREREALSCEGISPSHMEPWGLRKQVTAEEVPQERVARQHPPLLATFSHCRCFLSHPAPVT